MTGNPPLAPDPSDENVNLTDARMHVYMDGSPGTVGGTMGDPPVPVTIPIYLLVHSEKDEIVRTGFTMGDTYSLVAGAIAVMAHHNIPWAQQMLGAMIAINQQCVANAQNQQPPPPPSEDQQ